MASGALVIDTNSVQSHFLVAKLKKHSDFCNHFCNSGCKMAITYHRNDRSITAFSVILDHGIFHVTNSSVAFATTVAKLE